MYQLTINKQSPCDLKTTINLITQVLETINAIVNICEITVSSKGILIQAMDNKHVCLVKAFIDMSLFTEFTCNPNTRFVIAIPPLLDVLKKTQFNTVTDIVLTGDNTELHLLLNTPVLSIDHCFKLSNDSLEHYDIPEMDYLATITMDSNSFILTQQALDQRSNNVCIDISHEQVMFVTHNNLATAKVNLGYTQSPDTDNQQDADITPNVKIAALRDIKQEIGLNYMATIAKVAKYSELVTLSMGEYAPIRAELAFADAITLAYYIAPVVQE